MAANKSRSKKHDNPQPGRQRRRAQQWQRVDWSLLSERGRNETEWSGMSLNGSEWSLWLYALNVLRIITQTE